ncbi:MAG: alpha/beta hydrolase [Deltaproteobacteria bacterium]|nr:alpha/beta hydrolase [Deltaproteobacteria bacterium]
MAVNRGVLLHYEIKGEKGEPLLMLRGLSRSLDYWMGLDEILSQRFRVIVMDNRGVGRSSKPTGLWSIEEMADDTAAVIGASGLAPVCLFGMSLGGMVAQETVLRHPLLVSRLILACTTPGPKKGYRPLPSAVAGLILAGLLPLSISNEIVTRLTLSDEFRKQDESVGHSWLELGRKGPVSRISVFKQMLAVLGHDTGDRLGQINAPTLVMTGTADSIIDSRNSELMAELIPGAKLEYIHGAGHDFPAELPKLTADLIKDFCTSTRNA